jgi:hypothetical protein
MSLPNVYDVPMAKVAGNTLGASEVNAIGTAINLFAVRLAQLLGEGAFYGTDFVGTAVPGELELQISSGDALIGADGQRKLVWQEGAYIADAGDGILDASTIDFYLNRDGTWTAQVSSDPAPANSHPMIRAVFAGGEATSVIEHPDRRNIHPFIPQRVELDNYVLTIAAGSRKALKVEIGKGEFPHGCMYQVNVSHNRDKDKVQVLLEASKTGTEFWVHVINATGSGYADVTIDFELFGFGWTDADPVASETFTAYTFTP